MDFAKLDDLFTDAEQQLLLEGLQALLERKQVALREAATHTETQSFTANDFGIPAISGLISKIGGDEAGADLAPAVRGPTA